MNGRRVTLPCTLTILVGLSVAGCQSLAVAMDEPGIYDSPPPVVTGPGYNCAAQRQDAAIWGTLPSAFCAPYNSPFFWGRRAGLAPYYYGRPYGPSWRGPGYHHGSYRDGYGGWRGGRGGRR